MKARCRFASLAVLLFSLAFCCGCRNTEKLENELRSRDYAIRELREELERVEHHNEALHRELGAVQQQSAFKVSPEHASQVFTVKRITLGRGTAGFDNDRVPGDEGLQVVLEPRDSDDHVIKVPGTLQVQALEISAEGIKTLFSSWEVPPDQLRRYWKSGGLFGGTSYVVPLPWKSWPTHEQIRVVARFRLLDGRTFEADRDLRLRLAPAAQRVPQMPPAELKPEVKPEVQPEPMPAPEHGPELPFPRKLEPGKEPQSSTTFRPAPATVQRLSHWEAPTLQGAIRLDRPLPLPEAE